MANKKWDTRFLELTKLISTWSKDPSTQTGAAIVRSDRTVQSVGFNGFPRGFSDNAEGYENREEKYDRIIHCEINALIHANGPVHGCTLYTYPFACCNRCAVQMLQAGITRFVYPSPPEDTLARWAESFKKTESYFKEVGVEYLEVEFE